MAGTVTGMKVSVIVPVYGQLPFVLKLCKSIVRNPQPSLHEVILVDDCSPDFILSEVVGAPFHVIRNERNVQFVATSNIGAKAATGDLLLFLNSDIQVSENWLEPLVQLYETPQVLKDIDPKSNGLCGIVAPKLLFPPNVQGESLIQSAGGLYDVFKNPFHRYIGWLSNAKEVNKCERVSWATGAAILTPRSLFYQLGGFDEAYGRGYWDDCDYSERVKQAGYEIFYQPESVMIHATGTSMAGSIKTPEQMKAAAKSFRENMWRFHRKFDEVITPDVQIPMVSF